MALGCYTEASRRWIPRNGPGRVTCRSDARPTARKTRHLPETPRPTVMPPPAGLTRERVTRPDRTRSRAERHQASGSAPHASREARSGKVDRRCGSPHRRHDGSGTTRAPHGVRSHARTARERPKGEGSPHDSHSHPVPFTSLTRHDHGQGIHHRRRKQVFTFIQGRGRRRGQAQGPQDRREGGSRRGGTRRPCHGPRGAAQACTRALHGQPHRPGRRAGAERSEA